MPRPPEVLLSANAQAACQPETNAGPLMRCCSSRPPAHLVGAHQVHQPLPPWKGQLFIFTGTETYSGPQSEAHPGAWPDVKADGVPYSAVPRLTGMQGLCHTSLWLPSVQCGFLCRGREGLSDPEFTCRGQAGMCGTQRPTGHVQAAPPPP